jgi:Tat protein secretion system quality control protein TatD with DNase activity
MCSSKGYHPWFSHWITFDRRPKEQHYRAVLHGAAHSKPPDNEDEEFHKLLAVLPDPLFIDDLMLVLRDNLQSFPEALLGEVGLDRSMRVPLQSGPDGRQLSRFKVAIEHQLRVLERQVALAVELKRSISLHSVNCQAVTVEFLEKMRDIHKRSWYDINVDLHSCGLSQEIWKRIQVSDSSG